MVELEFGVLVFVEEGKPENPENHPKARTNNKLNPHNYAGIQAEPRWWEASAPTATSLLLSGLSIYVIS